MKKWYVEAGDVFGKLTLIKHAYSLKRKDGKSGERVWLCKCECGKTVEVRSSNLKSGNTKSCGCWHSEKTVESNIKRGKN